MFDVVDGNVDTGESCADLRGIRVVEAAIVPTGTMGQNSRL